MHIYFDYYPPYTDGISKKIETKINYNVTCFHVYPYSNTKVNMITWIYKKSWEMFKHCFPEYLTVTKFSKTTV